MNEKKQKLIQILVCKQCPCIGFNNNCSLLKKQIIADTSPPSICPLRKNDIVLSLADDV
jgi:hypothetical protein